MEAYQQRFRYNFARGRNRYARRREPESGLREMLVQQFIASGLILFVALAISFLPLSFSYEIRGGVKRALSQDGGELPDLAGGIAAQYDALRNSIRVMFEEPAAPTAPAAPTGLDYMPGAGIPQRVYPSEPGTQPELSGMDANIDEHILRSINTGEFYPVNESGSEDEKKY
ncbi:MAG: hypothetical protein FWE68_02000 [Defluviitaleaceae bacterium]|nr:hypothetical protein [Defluviitaleaceae bacterium]